MRRYSIFLLKPLLGLMALSTVLTVILLIGCGEQHQSPTETEEFQQEIVLSPSDPEVQAVMGIQDQCTDEFLKRPGIVGTGTGLTEDGKLAIVVFVREDVLAKEAALPPFVEEVPVIVRSTGEFKALRGKRPKIDPATRFDRPVPIGVSTGHPAITAGTIGCRVTNGKNVFALSNNHIYALTNAANLGDPIIQPGAFDGGSSPADDIGNLVDFEPVDFASDARNTIDAAIALSSMDLLGKTTPDGG